MSGTLLYMTVVLLAKLCENSATFVSVVLWTLAGAINNDNVEEFAKISGEFAREQSSEIYKMEALDISAREKDEEEDADDI